MKYQLSIGATSLLLQCLENSGWSESPKDVYQAGSLTVILDQHRPPTDVTKETLCGQVEIEITDGQFAVAQKAVTHFCSKGAVPANNHAVYLIGVLKLSE